MFYLVLDITWRGVKRAKNPANMLSVCCFSTANTVSGHMTFVSAVALETVKHVTETSYVQNSF